MPTRAASAEHDSLLALVRLLQEAYSGEMAAAFAYRGHWKSVRDPAKRATILKIEREEWHHRQIVGKMLEALRVKPVWWKEAKSWLVGRALGPLCFVSGHFLPMYFAWKLEVKNVNEYDAAVRHADACHHSELIPELRQMSAVEQEHEQFFRGILSAPASGP